MEQAICLLCATRPLTRHAAGARARAERRRRGPQAGALHAPEAPCLEQRAGRRPEVR